MDAVVELQTTHLQAGNPLSTAHRLRELLRSADLETRLRLAENEASPPDVLEKLSQDNDPEVRASVANNPSITSTTLEKLSTDAHEDVRFSLASNPNLPIQILQNLSQDQNPYVGDRAHKTIDGLVLELDLEAQGFVCLPGDNARLGELLVASGIIHQKEIDVAIVLAKSMKVPLGRALVQAGRIDRSTIVYALRQQTLVRLGQISLVKAIETIRDYICRRHNLC
jgi:hypothetical protein